MVLTVEQLTEDPHPHLAALRRTAPLTWVPALDGWLVTAREAAVAVLRDPDAFTVDDPRFSTGRVVGPSMLSLEGAAHARAREAFAGSFRPAAMHATAAAQARTRARALVRSMSDEGGAELRTALAGPLAAGVIADVLGLAVPPEEILAWYREIVGAVDALTADRSADPGGVPVGLRRAVLGAGAGSTLHAARAAGDLTDDELVANAAVVMFGAIETTEAMIANLCWHVLAHDDVAHVLRADPGRRPAAIEESLRLEPGAAVVDRYATREVSLAGVTIGSGDLVIVSLAAANRDPAAFDDPDRFDPDRSGPAHLTFAQGLHTCLGLHLARVEAAAALDAVLDDLPVLRFDRARSAGPRGLVFRKAAAVVVTWDSVRA